MAALSAVSEMTAWQHAVRWLGLLATIAAFGASADERWYQLTLDGNPAGTSHEVSEPDEAYPHTVVESRMVIDRSGHRLEIQLHTDTQENSDGLWRSHLVTTLAGDETVIDATVGSGRLHLRTTTSAGQYDRDLEVTTLPLGPERLRQMTLSRLHQRGDAFDYWQLREDSGEVMHVTRTLTADRIPDHPFTVIDHSDDGDTTETLDRDGQLIESVEESPLGRLVATRLPAAPEQDTLAGAPIPVAAQLSVSPPIADPREVRRLTLTIALERGPGGGEALSAEDFVGPGQTVESETHDRVVLHIRPAGSDAASFQPPTPEELAPNALLPSDAPVLRQWAAEVTANAPSDEARLSAIVAAVHDTLRFDPGFAVANALDVLKRRRGTCVAYATLTAAIARALHHPARVVYGYVYADGALIGHAWTEVWINGHWRGVDAALYRTPSIDAARIALARSDGAEGLASGISALSRRLGHFTVVPGSARATH